jgi:elongation of very long chain fatty acids protein 6
MLFTVSKLFELFDTVLLVLRKKHVMFLHWYHHATVLLYTWFSYSARNPGIYFIAMNYSVHAVMYT